jgi:hypothetical protein
MAVGGKPPIVLDFRIEKMSVREGRVQIAAGDSYSKLSVDVRGEALQVDSWQRGKLEGTVTLTPLATPQQGSIFPVVFFGWQREGFTAALQALKEAAEQKAQELKTKPAASASSR